MKNKLGRNDVCGCDSGLKYKKCCLPKGIIYALDNYTPKYHGLEIKDVFNKYHKYELAAYFAAASLNPINHGKNVRLDYLTISALIYGSSDSNKSLEFNKINNYILSTFQSHPYEDPIENIFTRNICYKNGNALVYEGIFTYGAKILQHLIITLNTFGSEFDNIFIESVNSKINFILEISNALAFRCNHKRNIYLEWSTTPNEIVFNLNNYTPEIVFFHKERIDRLLKLCKSNYEGIKDFFLDASKIDFQNVFIENNNENELLSNPIINTDNGFYIAAPTNLIIALVHNIWVSAKVVNCLEPLISKMHSYSIVELNNRLIQLEYYPMSIKQKENSLPEYLLYELDSDKCLIVICKYDLGNDYKTSTICNQNNLFESVFTNEELNDIIYQNKDKIINKSLQIFSIVFTIGRNISILSEIESYHLTGSYFDIMAILNSNIETGLDLWYYNKVEKQYSETTQFGPGNTSLDRFALYYKNKSFYLSDNEKPSYLSIITDGNFEVIKHGILKKDTLNALYNSTDYARAVYLTVYKFNDNVNRHYNLGIIQNRLEFYISNWPFSLWIKNDRQTNDIPNNLKNAYWECNEALCFWLYEIGPSIQNLFNGIQIKHPFVFDICINLSDDHSPIEYKRDEILQIEKFEQIENAFNIKIIKFGFQLHIPKNFSYLCLQKNNDADRLLLKLVLKGLHEYFTLQNIFIDANKFQQIIDIHAPKGLKKYLLIMSNESNFSFDNRYLDKSLSTSISEENYELIHDKIISLLGDRCPPLGEIIGKSNKLTLCKNITIELANKISEYIKNYNSYDLLHQLMSRYEATLHDSELYKFRVPTLVECYKDKRNIQKEIQGKLQIKDKSTLILRCIIEYIASENTIGSKNVTQEVVDDLCSLMSILIFYGSYHDIIVANLFETKLWILNSMRIGTNNKEIEKTFTERFNKHRANKTIQETIEFYYEDYSIKTAKLQEGLYEKLSKAFYKDYNVSFENLKEIISYLQILPFEKETSLIDLEINELINIIYDEFKKEISREIIKSAIDFLSMENRNGMLKNVPKDFDLSDIFPWKFNRRLSYLYKPLIKYVTSEKITRILYTPRHLEKCFTYLGSKVMNGQFKCNDKGEVKKVIGKLSQLNGKNLQKEILEYFSLFENLVINEEFKIGEDKSYIEGIDLGDIDVVVIDSENKTVLCVESKRTEESRNMREFAGEVEDYLGENGYIFKHRRRHEWACQNTSKIGLRYGISTNGFTVLSCMITKEKLAIQFMSDRKIGLPIFTLRDFAGMSLISIFEVIFTKI